MNKYELVDAIAAKSEINKREVDKILDLAFDIIKERVASGETVAIVGFGSFKLEASENREEIELTPGALIKPSVDKKPVFHAGMAFKAKIVG